MEQRDYVRRLLDAYRVTPGTCGAVRGPDRVLAPKLLGVRPRPRQEAIA